MVTIADVAKHAGVSSMTVSRVINNKGYISAETREAVMQAITQLHYQPNLVARTLASGSSGTLGLLCTHIKNPIYARYIDSLCQEIKSCERDVILYMANDEDSVRKGLSTLLSKQVDGIVVLPIELADVYSTSEDYDQIFSMVYEQAENSRKPFVFLGPFADSGYPCVFEDYCTGAHMATKYLISLGHRNIACMAGSTLGGYPWSEREKGFRMAMDEHGLVWNENLRIESLPDLQDAKASVSSYIQKMQGHLPTAIYCASDILAVGAVHAMTEANIRVPDDISIIGHDDGPFARSCYPPLTTVAISPKDTAAKAASILLSILAGKHYPAEKNFPMTPHLRIRSSTKAPSSLSK